MTPQEKAKELFDKIDTVIDEWGNYPMCFDTSKQCALIVVDEIIEEALGLDDNDYQSKYDYWEQVKQELEKL